MTLYNEDELLMLSGIQHIAFCERQFALAYIECQWSENIYTIQGHYLHERVDDPFESEHKDNTIYLRSVYVLSYELGLYGKADLIELSRKTDSDGNIKLKGQPDYWSIKPVEYKKGKPKPDPCDDIQLCAQAMCLEEMYQVFIPSAEIFYGEPRRRIFVELNDSLRMLTKQYAKKMHELFESQHNPKPVYKNHCHSCSLYDFCNPKGLSKTQTVEQYLQNMLSFKQ